MKRNVLAELRVKQFQQMLNNSKPKEEPKEVLVEEEPVEEVRVEEPKPRKRKPKDV